MVFFSKKKPSGAVNRKALFKYAGRKDPATLDLYPIDDLRSAMAVGIFAVFPMSFSGSPPNAVFSGKLCICCAKWRSPVRPSAAFVAYRRYRHRLRPVLFALKTGYRLELIL